MYWVLPSTARDMELHTMRLTPLMLISCCMTDKAQGVVILLVGSL